MIEYINFFKSFSTFGKEDYCNSLKQLLNSVIKYTPKVSDLWELLINFRGNSDEEFHKYLKQQLGNEFYI